MYSSFVNKNAFSKRSSRRAENNNQTAVIVFCLMSDGEARGIELGIKRELWLSRQ